MEQRRNEGDEEGYEQLSDYWLKYKIWQVEQEWAVEKYDEVQPSYIMSANVSSLRKQEENEASEPNCETKQNNHMENSNMEKKNQTEPKLMLGSNTEGSCDPEIEKEGSQDELSRLPQSEGLEAPQACTSCDPESNPAVGA